MLIIAICIAFPYVQQLLRAKTAISSARLLASLSIFYIIHSLQKRKERLIHAAKLLNINKSAKQNNRFFHIALADICC